MTTFTAASVSNFVMPAAGNANFIRLEFQASDNDLPFGFLGKPGLPQDYVPQGLIIDTRGISTALEVQVTVGGVLPFEITAPAGTYASYIVPAFANPVITVAGLQAADELVIYTANFPLFPQQYGNPNLSINLSSFFLGTIAALRALTNSTTNSTVTVSGYAAPADGGGGIFVVNAADTASADNGGTIIVDAAGRRWYRVYSGALNVKWFGAKGDGTTDDTAAITSAHAAALAGGDGVIFRGGDTYLIGTAGTGGGPSIQWDWRVPATTSGPVTFTTALASGILFQFAGAPETNKPLRPVWSGDFTIQNTNSSNTMIARYFGQVPGASTALNNAQTVYEGVHVTGFAIADTYGSNAFIITHRDCHLIANGIGGASGTVISVASGATNSGEKIIYQNCLLANNDSAIFGTSSNVGSFEFLLDGCSIDYNAASTLDDNLLNCDVNQLSLTVFGCHFEWSSGSLVNLSGSQNSLRILDCVYVSAAATTWITNASTSSTTRIHGATINTGTTTSGNTFYNGTSATSTLSIDASQFVTTTSPNSIASWATGSNQILTQGNIKSVNAAVDLLASDSGSLYLVGYNSAAAFTITLPAPTLGFNATFYGLNNNTNAVELAASGGTAPFYLPNGQNLSGSIPDFIGSHMSVRVESDGQNYYVTNVAGNAVSTYTSGISAETVPASPAVFTAPNRGTYYVEGGTVSSIALARSGTTVGVNTAGSIPIPVSFGDQVTVTYSAAPTVYFVPS